MKFIENVERDRFNAFAINHTLNHYSKNKLLYRF